MKRVIVCFLTLVLLFGTCLFAVSAAGTGSLSMTGAEGKQGDTVTVTVNLSSNPGLITMKFAVSYPSDLELLSVQNSGLLGGWTSPAPTISSPYTIRWADSLATTNNTATGTVVTLTFKIKDFASPGVKTISLTFNESRDAEGGKNTFGNASTTITVNCKFHTYGSYTSTGDMQHSRTCSACGHTENADHNWNSGTVNKQPSCKETGEKNYACSTCNATKVKTLEKTNDHSYSAWSKVNDTSHSRTCSVCQKVETTNHSWNSGSITKQPTCKETGIKTFTCTGCSATRTEDIAKTATHSYGKWTKVNDSTHKHTCSVCAKEETANHSWNSGSITKQPTCKDAGVKTFTCTGCSTTRTEAVAKTTTHNYGSWGKVYDSTHKHTCSVCKKEETANHSWNTGTVTKQPTCKDTGIRTFTCTGCGLTKAEDVTKLTTHTYDHGCDTDCNICGLTRQTTHSYGTSWSKDKTNHWYECSECKEKKDTAAHTPGAEPTETKAQTCTVCGYIVKPALGHTHKYAETLSTDDTGHWYACSGCEEKSSYAEHDFENACDPDCSICGLTRETAHTYSEVYESDEANHWRSCSGCGDMIEEAAHVPGMEATATTAQTCTVCQYEIAPALGGEEPKPAAPANDNSNETSFPWIIVIVAAILVLGGGTAGFIIYMKKKG